MKYLPLLWSGIWRKRGRTALVLLQVAVAFALFGVLQGMKTGVDRAVAKTRADLLIVTPADFGGAPLPLSYLDRLRSIPGMKSVHFADGFLGTYQKPTQPVYVLAIRPTKLWVTLVPEMFQVLPKDLDALKNTRDGALITADIGRKYGWHVGDRIPLTSTTLKSDGSGTWSFQIVGTFTDHEPGEAGFIVGNYDYLDQARSLNKGTVRNFYAMISDPEACGGDVRHHRSRVRKFVQRDQDRLAAGGCTTADARNWRSELPDPLGRRCGARGAAVLHHHHDDADDSRANARSSRC